MPQGNCPTPEQIAAAQAARDAAYAAYQQAQATYVNLDAAAIAARAAADEALEQRQEAEANWLAAQAAYDFLVQLMILCNGG